MRVGFYDYATAAVGTDGVIYKEDLTSAPASGATPSGSDDAFGADGWTATTDGQIIFTGITDQDLLATEGTVMAMVSRHTFTDNAAPGTRYILRFIGGDTMYLQKTTSGNTSLVFVDSTRPTHKFLGADAYCNADDLSLDDMVPLVVTWDAGGIQVWWDYSLAIDVSWPDSDHVCTFSRIDILAGDTQATTWKNLLFASKKIVIPTASKGL